MEYEIKSLYRAVIQGVIMSAALLTYICYALTQGLAWLVISIVATLSLIFVGVYDIALTIRHHKESKKLAKRLV